MESESRSSFIESGFSSRVDYDAWLAAGDKAEDQDQVGEQSFTLKSGRQLPRPSYTGFDAGVAVERIPEPPPLTQAMAAIEEIEDPLEELASCIALANISHSKLTADVHSPMLTLDDFMELIRDKRIPAATEVVIAAFDQLDEGKTGAIRPQDLLTALMGTNAFDTGNFKLADFRSMSSRSPRPSMFARRPSRGMTGGGIGRRMTGGFGIDRQMTDGFGIGRQMTGGMVSRQATSFSEALGENSTERYVSLVAHNDMKPTMMLFVATHLEFFRERQIITTGSTGKALEEKLGLEVACKVSSGPLGGDQEIGALISQGHVAAVFFFRDPLSAHPHESDIQALVRICDVHNIMTASNTATGSAVIHALQESIEHREHLDMSPADFSLTDSEVVAAYKAKQKLAIANAVAGPETPAPAIADSSNA